MTTLCLCGQSLAQESSQLATGGQPQSHRVQHVSIPIDYEQFAAYWTEEPGWHTDLQLCNYLGARELTVTPSLRSPDGTEVKLAPVTIQPRDVMTVALHDAIMKAAPRFTATYGSVVFRYRSPVAKALTAMTVVHLEGRPIAFHVDAYLQPEKWVTGSREGIWWLPRPTATDYLILTNTADKGIEANLLLRDSSGNSWQQRVLLEGRQTLRMSARALLEKAKLRGPYGGITIDVANGIGYLDSLHVIIDEVAGSSAVMKMFDHDPTATLAERAWSGLKDWTIRAPMLALTRPDVALGFPSDTSLQPQLFVRNVSAKPREVPMHFNRHSGSASGKTQPSGF